MGDSVKSSSAKSWTLVIIQFVCLAGIALTGPWVARGIWLLPQITGGALGLWALWAMRQGQMNVLPDVREGARLLRVGPYAWVRHPMYTGLIVLTAAMLISDFSWLRLVFWLGLVINFDVKLRYEETLLLARFPAYAQYKQETARLIPGIY